MSGCAKTTTAMKILQNLSLNKWICIAFTHSAVNNLKEIFLRQSKLKIAPQKNFMTIHKFLQIPISATGDYTIIKHKKLKYLAELVIVDEFSLIPLDIMEYLFELSITSTNFIFVGDFIQLMPISLNREPISLSLLNSSFSNINLSFNEAIRIADHLSNSVYTSEYFKKAQKMVLLHNYRNGDNVYQVLNDALDYKFDISMGAKTNNIISLFEIPKYVKEGYIILSSMYKHLERAYLYLNPCITSENEDIKNTKIGKIKVKIGDKMILLDNLDDEFVNGDVVIIKNILKDNDVEIEKENEECENENENENKIKMKNTRIIDSKQILPYNFITCHKAQGRTISKVLLILDDLFEITMLYTAITRAKDDIKFIKFNHLPSKTDINAFKIMRDVIYKIPENDENK